MSKDPAVLLYTSDFLSGCSDLTMLERGQFITLLCLQHQKEVLTKKLIELTCGSNISEDVMSRFTKDKNGNYFNKRMDFERKKRKAHSDKQSLKAKARWDKVKENKLTKQPVEDATACAVVMPLENENENENENRIKSKSKKIEIVFPYNDKDFIHSWGIWKQYLKESRNPIKSKIQEQAALKRLSNMSDNSIDAIEIIEYTIAQGYKGLWKEKKNSNYGTKNNTNSQSKYSTDFEELINEKIRSD